MAIIREITDSGSEPGYPTIEEMRKSQADGSVGNGTQPRSYNQVLSDFNQECSVDGDETPSDTPSKGASLPFLP